MRNLHLKKSRHCLPAPSLPAGPQAPPPDRAQTKTPPADTPGGTPDAEVQAPRSVSRKTEALQERLQTGRGPVQEGLPGPGGRPLDLGGRDSTLKGWEAGGSSAEAVTKIGTGYSSTCFRVPGLSPRRRRRQGRREENMATGGRSHSPARLRSQYHPRALLWHLQRTRSSPTHGHRSRKRFTQPCAKAWRSLDKPTRVVTPAPSLARERLSQTQTRQGPWGSHLSPPPQNQLPALFPSLVRRPPGSFPPALGEPSLQDPKRWCGHGAHTPHLPFLPRAGSLPLTQHNTTQNLPGADYQPTFTKPS